MREFVSRTIGAVAVVMSMLALPGCAVGYRPVTRVGYAIFSDDDTRVAYTRVSYERGSWLLPGGSSDPTRNYSYDILTAALDGSDVRTIVSGRAGIASLETYMHTAGYFIVEHWNETTWTNSTSEGTFIKIAMDGTSSNIQSPTMYDSGARYSVIPSPDGSKIVRYFSVPRCISSNSFDPDCGINDVCLIPGECPFDHEARVVFLDAATLTPLEQSVGRTEERHEFSEYLEATFLTDGTFVVRQIIDHNDEAVAFSPNAAPNVIASPADECFNDQVPTTSSTVAADGRYVEVNGAEDGFIVRAGPPPSWLTPFGCAP